MNRSDVDFPFGEAVLFSPADDELHAVGPHPDWTETVWFSFNVPERGLGGWLYTQIRPNLGICSGGAFVYSAGTWAAFEQPYAAYFHYLPLPDPLDLRDVTFRNGVSIKMIEPGMVYELGYRFRDHTEFVADLRFEGITPPVPHLHGAPPFTGSSHYDQHGRVTGTIHLDGEAIGVDCIAVRDRSWGRRPERVGREVARLSYLFGATGSDECFLAFCTPVDADDPTGVERLSSGYLLRDGALRRLAAATRTTIRHPATGGIERVELRAEDTDGRSLIVTGKAVSRMALNEGGLCINTLLKFAVERRSGVAEGWGEDQDVWSNSSFASKRRRAAPSR